MIIFAAYSIVSAPLAGLTPSWVVLFDAGTGLPIAQPGFTDLGDGLYQIGAGINSASAGIIDLGATALPRFLHLNSKSPDTIAAYDVTAAPLASLTPVWDSFVDGDGVPASQPTFTELAGGLYRVNYSGPDSRAGVVDFGATAFPRFFSFNFDPFDTDPPTITNMVPSPGDIAQLTPIDFDVKDLDPGLLRVIITLKYDASLETIVVHDGIEFKNPFDTVTSVRTAIGDGFHYTLLPAGGWTSGFTLDVTAIDSDGNLV